MAEPTDSKYILSSLSVQPSLSMLGLVVPQQHESPKLLILGRTHSGSSSVRPPLESLTALLDTAEHCKQLQHLLAYHVYTMKLFPREL